MITETLNIITNKLSSLICDVNLNFEAKQSFGDLLNNVQEDTLKSFIDGCKLCFNLNTNVFGEVWSILTGSIFKHLNNKEGFEYLFGILGILEFTSDLNFKMGEHENNIFWKKLPEIKLFSTDNVMVKKLVKNVNLMKEGFPLVGKVLNLFQELNGRNEIGINTPFGFLRFKSESFGLMEVWDILTMIHYS
jgi:hypothetical protein